jgi:hypothetical protein|tara:strand:+ start:1216 stop:1509 length:294 start_codon:yes stop_codon:yes gene_type:complete
MTQFRLFGGSIHSALVHAATQHDIKEARKKYHNIYALAQYLTRINEVEDNIAAGASVRAALIAGFSGRLLSCLLKAVGEPPFSAKEVATQGYTYTPA